MRYLEPFIINDLQKKMVWIGGPRQCGKTYLANQILKNNYPSGEYFNWDRDVDRLKILKEKWSPASDLLVFDEIHKYTKWKSLIKGYYDTFKSQHKFLVTGSARLDTFKKGGDSLLGRYHYWQLHPFTLSESIPKMKKDEILKRLLNFSGFPEPFFDGNHIEAARWRQERYDRIIKDDIRDLENIKDIHSMQLLLDLLRQRVGGPIVVSNLAEDLKKSPITILNWINLFEKMYLIFKVTPFTKNISRAIQKPFKVYFYDNQDVNGDEGARFENFVATHLLKWVHFQNDSAGKRFELRFIRDKEKREVDFAITHAGNLHALIEAKLADEKISPHLAYYAEKLKPLSASQIVLHLKRSYSANKLQLHHVFDSPWIMSLT